MRLESATADSRQQTTDNEPSKHGSQEGEPLRPPKSRLEPYTVARVGSQRKPNQQLIPYTRFQASHGHKARQIAASSYLRAEARVDRSLTFPAMFHSLTCWTMTTFHQPPDEVPISVGHTTTTTGMGQRHLRLPVSFLPSQFSAEINDRPVPQIAGCQTPPFPRMQLILSCSFILCDRNMFYAWNLMYWAWVGFDKSNV